MAAAVPCGTVGVCNSSQKPPATRRAGHCRCRYAESAAAGGTGCLRNPQGGNSTNGRSPAAPGHSDLSRIYLGYQLPSHHSATPEGYPYVKIKPDTSNCCGQVVDAVPHLVQGISPQAWHRPPGLPAVIG